MAKSIVDNTDIKIIEKLDEDIRKGSKEIGDMLKLRRQVVDYRIRRMEANGVIAGYRMLANLTKLGFYYYRLHIKLNSTPKKEKEELFDFLVGHKKSVWAVECDGKYDAISGFVCSNAKEFQEIVINFLRIYSKYVNYYDTVHVLELIIPSRDFSGTKEIRSIKGFICGNFNPEDFSELDKKIINQLAENGHQSALEIAKKIKATPEKVNYHIKQIMKKGFMFSNIQFGYDVFGFELYKTLFYLKNPSRKRIEEFKKFARSYIRIWDYVETLGKWQFELDIESKGHEDYYKIMDAIQENFSDIIEYHETLYIRKERKFLYSAFQ